MKLLFFLWVTLFPFQSQIGDIPEVNINKPIIERTSKNSKYKKKGRVYSDDETEVTEKTTRKTEQSHDDECKLLVIIG